MVPYALAAGDRGVSTDSPAERKQLGRPWLMTSSARIVDHDVVGCAVTQMVVCFINAIRSDRVATVVSRMSDVV